MAATLARLRWDVQGQYSYVRTNESGMNVDFSTDLHACQHYSTATHWLATLDLLVECKYASPGIQWIFVPYPDGEVNSCVPGLVKIIDHAANKRVIQRRSLAALEQDLDYCIRGIALHEAGFDEGAGKRIWWLGLSSNRSAHGV